MYPTQRLQKIETSQANIFVFEGTLRSFDIQRVYYIRDVAVGTIRGHHAHKTLQQVIVCPYGAVRIGLDDGLNIAEYIDLDQPDKALYVGPSLWRTMEWLKPDSVLLVFASHTYSEEDYIRDYGDFLKYVQLTTGEKHDS